MEFEVEKKFKCPYCSQRISMLIDTSEDGDQSYIEDCEVCCHPIQINFAVEHHELVSFYQEATS